jgi:nucleotidyltransferase substrate binding protein (TIGR01987 family)
MDSLEYRYQNVLQTVSTLATALNLLEDPRYEIYKSLRDSAIQRFEYSIDTFWKFLKAYLREAHHIVLEITIPREVIRSALDLALISKEEYNVLLECVSDRNITSHTYKEVLAQAILERIPLYFHTMEKILSRIKPCEHQKPIP